MTIHYDKSWQLNSKQQLAEFGFKSLISAPTNDSPDGKLEVTESSGRPVVFSLALTVFIPAPDSLHPILFINDTTPTTSYPGGFSEGIALKEFKDMNNGTSITDNPDMMAYLKKLLP